MRASLICFSAGTVLIEAQPSLLASGWPMNRYDIQGSGFALNVRPRTKAPSAQPIWTFKPPPPPVTPYCKRHIQTSHASSHTQGSETEQTITTVIVDGDRDVVYTSYEDNYRNLDLHLTALKVRTCDLLMELTRISILHSPLVVLFCGTLRYQVGTRLSQVIPPNSTCPSGHRPMPLQTAFRLAQYSATAALSSRI
jgi:hypothetical protein